MALLGTFHWQQKPHFHNKNIPSKQRKSEFLFLHLPDRKFGAGPMLTNFCFITLSKKKKYDAKKLTLTSYCSANEEKIIYHLRKDERCSTPIGRWTVQHFQIFYQ